MKLLKICLWTANVGLAAAAVYLSVQAMQAPQVSKQDQPSTEVVAPGPFGNAAEPTPQPVAQQPARPTVDPRLEQLTLHEYPRYNAFIPAILAAADETGVPERILALTILTESNNMQADRYEPGFQQLYIEPLFRQHHPNRRLQDIVQRMLHRQMEQLTVRDESEFKRQLATSYGPAQIMYVTAIENGFTGTADELRGPQTSIRYAARRIRAHEGSTRYDPQRVLIDYNTGSIHGDPAQGHLTRGMRYWQMLQH